MIENLHIQFQNTLLPVAQFIGTKKKGSNRLMAKKSNTHLKMIYDGFKGIDTRTSHGVSGVCDLLNFRILPDGSIKKRSGYKAIYTSNDVVRAIWSGHIGGNFVCCFLAGNKVYTLDVKTGATSFCATIGTLRGKAQFFYIRDSLYLIDGSNIYKIGNSFADIQQGYVPLLGKDWDVGYPGEIYEPLNLLNNKARITYLVGESVSAYLPTLYPVSHIDAVYKNDVLLSNTDYYFDSRFNTIDVAGLATGDRLEANVTYAEINSDERSQLLSSTSATVFGGINNSRLFTWGGSVKNKMFTSTYVSRSDLAASEQRYPSSGHLYFQSGNNFEVGDGKYNVTAAVRHYDRLLILTDGDAWIADTSACGEEEFPVMNVNSSTGCNADCGAVMAGNDPISVGNGSVYRWTSDTDELNECNAFSISKPIDSLLDSSFFSKARILFHRPRNEVWLCDPDGDGSVWIYNTLKDAWYRFENIHATDFFDAGDDVGFLSGNTFYVFSDELNEDFKTVGSSVGSEISANFTSSFSDMGDASDRKKLSSLVCKLDPDNSAVSISICTNKGELLTRSVGGGSGHRVADMRLNSQRFTCIEVILHASGEGRQVIHSLEIDARK